MARIILTTFFVAVLVLGFYVYMTWCLLEKLMVSIHETGGLIIKEKYKENKS